MKLPELKNHLWFTIISLILILIAIFDVFEQTAIEYIKGISEKNIGFLGLVIELKLIFSGVSDFIPFLKEHNSTINESLEKAEHYLMTVNIISLVQLMLLEISKAWLIKVLIVILFLATFFRSSKKLSSRLLILVLALNPGLTIYSVTMHHLSQTSSFDYGQEYLTELKATADTLQAERSQIMQEHAKKLTEINNGKKGIVLFKKLKEDISYDLKKAKTTIKGDYSEIRLIIRDGGKEIVRKIFIFCTMVLFSLLIVPIGYVVIVYTIYRTVITTEVKQEIQTIEKSVKSKLVDEPTAKFEKAIQKPKDIVNKVTAKVKGAEQSMETDISAVERSIDNKKDNIESTIKEDEKKVEEVKNSAESQVNEEISTAKKKAKKAENDIDDIKKKL